MFVSSRRMRILDFDLENRPLSYWADRPSAEVTAIAWCWVDDPDSMEVAMLTTQQASAARMLRRFITAYDQADMVVGHYIRKHDLPILQGALLELNMPLLGPKLVQDTRLDLPKEKDLPVSQEALAEMVLGVNAKEHMSQPAWRRANRLGADGLAETKRRVVGDVRQNIAMRAELLRRGLLGQPRMWYPR
jgi:hypothetical protein